MGSQATVAIDAPDYGAITPGADPYALSYVGYTYVLKFTVGAAGGTVTFDMHAAQTLIGAAASPSGIQQYGPGGRLLHRRRLRPRRRRGRRHRRDHRFRTTTSPKTAITPAASNRPLARRRRSSPPCLRGPELRHVLHHVQVQHRRYALPAALRLGPRRGRLLPARARARVAGGAGAGGSGGCCGDGAGPEPRLLLRRESGPKSLPQPPLIARRDRGYGGWLGPGRREGAFALPQ